MHSAIKFEYLILYVGLRIKVLLNKQHPHTSLIMSGRDQLQATFLPVMLE